MAYFRDTSVVKFIYITTTLFIRLNFLITYVRRTRYARSAQKSNKHPYVPYAKTLNTFREMCSVLLEVLLEHAF